MESVSPDCENMQVFAVEQAMEEHINRNLAIVYDEKGFVTLVLDDCSVVLGESTFLDEKVSRIEADFLAVTPYSFAISFEKYESLNKFITELYKLNALLQLLESGQ